MASSTDAQARSAAGSRRRAGSVPAAGGSDVTGTGSPVTGFPSIGACSRRPHSPIGMVRAVDRAGAGVGRSGGRPDAKKLEDHQTDQLNHLVDWPVTYVATPPLARH
ncbi:hypothetical protein GCM10009687_49010 [Asanoa iriomotensis]|uniref:Uncharacterized protein n=1 Tax=Asanoa iriomotensis TaxID=234613 RepID=A0ABQ4C086_9ACTN|nr:hypothetical protein Air01nite_22880 [Asanoa iriomotensis]